MHASTLNTPTMHTKLMNKLLFFMLSCTSKCLRLGPNNTVDVIIFLCLVSALAFTTIIVGRLILRLLMI
jgi:hypothetical protein